MASSPPPQVIPNFTKINEAKVIDCLAKESQTTDPQNEYLESKLINESWQNKIQAKSSNKKYATANASPALIKPTVSTPTSIDGKHEYSQMIYDASVEDQKKLKMIYDAYNDTIDRRNRVSQKELAQRENTH